MPRTMIWSESEQVPRYLCSEKPSMFRNPGFFLQQTLSKVTGLLISNIYRHRGWFWLKLYYLELTTIRIICGLFDLIFLSNVWSKVPGNLNGCWECRGEVRGERGVSRPNGHFCFSLLIWDSLSEVSDRHHTRPSRLHDFRKWLNQISRT